MRALIDIPEAELAALSALSKARSISRAELVRQAIRSYMKLNLPTGEVDGFGLWKDYEFDSDDYQQKLRSEWDRDEGDLC